VNQELLWRPFDWWEVRVNLASRSRERGQEGRRGTMILPVGNRSEVLKVLELTLPELLAADGMEPLVRAALERGSAVAPTTGSRSRRRAPASCAGSLAAATASRCDRMPCSCAAERSGATS
jgi:putative membrane protein